MPSVAGTLVSGELLNDVHLLCQQQPGGAGDDTRPLQRHLLRGRGAKCLLALNLLGTQVSLGSALTLFYVFLNVCFCVWRSAKCVDSYRLRL
jgi:hypothetical protein